MRSSGEGASQDQINAVLGRAAGDLATSRTLERLSRAGYLADELTVEQVDGPLSCRLSEKGLQQVAGWPGASGRDLASQLLALIDSRIRTPRSPRRNAAGWSSSATPSAMSARVWSRAS